MLVGYEGDENPDGARTVSHGGDDWPKRVVATFAATSGVSA
jgi:hypothetical protein